MRGTLTIDGPDGGLRGLPFFYDAGDVREMIVTDDPTSAADASASRHKAER